MSKKRLEPQMGDFIKHSSEELPTELVEISEEDLQQIVGGNNFWKAVKGGVGAKWNAIVETAKGTATEPTLVDLVIPTHWHIISRWLW